MEEAFESKCLKANLGKTKLMVSDGNTKDGFSKSNVDLWRLPLRSKG